MIDRKFMTPSELSARWEGRITVRTLANWRTGGSGPPFTKIGGAVLYPRDQVVQWEASNTVCNTSQYRAAGAQETQ